MSEATVVSVNVGRPRHLSWGGRSVETGIWKLPVAGPVEVGEVNLAGDGQADLRVHGGRDKAVYAYAVEDYAWWSGELGAELEPGSFGENLTVGGLDLAAALIGEVWVVGTARLQVTQPRLPCYKLGIRMGDQGFVARFEAGRRFGAYLRVLTPGTVEAGDPVEVVSLPAHDLTVTALGVAGARPEPELIRRILSVPEVPAGWREWAERAQHRTGSS